MNPREPGIKRRQFLIRTGLLSLVGGLIPSRLLARAFEDRVRRMIDGLAGLPHVLAEMWVPEIANHVPHLLVTWDPDRLPLSSSDVYQHLLSGDPRVAVRERAPHGVIISPLMLRREQDAAVLARLRAALGAT